MRLRFRWPRGCRSMYARARKGGASTCFKISLCYITLYKSRDENADRPLAILQGVCIQGCLPGFHAAMEF